MNGERINMKIAYAGSFDPFTNGHLHIINKVNSIMPSAELVILIANNASKKHNFSADDRMNMIKNVLRGDGGPKTSIAILPSDRYAVEFAQSIGCSAMVRGIRTEVDFQDESGIYQANKLICPTMETIYVMPDISLSAVRSSLVMGLVGPVNWIDTIDQLVPHNVLLEICKRFCFKTAEVEKISGDLSCYDVNPYHNWIHIAHCMSEYLRLGFEDIDYLRGILFHDAIDPSKLDHLDLFCINPDREEIYPDTILDIRAAVEATNHENLPTNLNEVQKVIHDIDMSILASRAGTYDRYVRNIKKEYCEVKGVPLDVFHFGRVKFLKKVLSQKIFLTQYYNEAKAVENLQRELMSLT